ncbi:MAG: hypothetical protein SA378_08820 [Sedimentibacter sp.]|uniref:hypothetical protein n=1 Tax=Sedimentibacter sp. TaxID=1960295 RepID=UPI002980EAB6|nr:hypothetical protein [Sedimentibacter sp.]MDW5300224.1 hypothetical protein [Sedimentibacter sp.]
MSVYYTKCGKKFSKSTNAETTGYICETDPNGQLNEKCRMCRFSQVRKNNQGELIYECRAGSKPPNLMNTLEGNFNDMNALRIYSLNLDFCNEIFDYAEADPELVPYKCKDSADCRKVISISSSKNKKGIAAKKKLAEKFFHVAGD